VAVREQAYMPFTRRHPRLGLPVLRGAISFVEMMIIGLGALSYSADVAMQQKPVSEDEGEDTTPWRDRLALAGSLVLALGLGIGLFFFVPLVVASVLHVDRGAVPFNLVAGLVRASLLLLYLWAISRWGEIRRVFQYHGAEHKSIFTLEAARDLTVEQARSQSRFHPRCGTSFMLIVVLLAVGIFSAVDSLFPLMFGHAQSLVERFATHVTMLPVIGGLGFELLKLSGRNRHHPLTRVLIAPGLWLQRITTQEPDDAQLEVGLTALRRALDGVAAPGVVAEERQSATAPS